MLQQGSPLLTQPTVLQQLMNIRVVRQFGGAEQDNTCTGTLHLLRANNGLHVLPQSTAVVSSMIPGQALVPAQLQTGVQWQPQFLSSVVSQPALPPPAPVPAPTEFDQLSLELNAFLRLLNNAGNEYSGNTDTQRNANNLPVAAAPSVDTFPGLPYPSVAILPPPSCEPSQRLSSAKPQKRFKCNECNKSFVREQSLKCHRKIHGPDAYSCSECGKLFARRSNLVQHTRVHTNERPFPCMFCSKAFKQQNTLNSHIRLHVDERPFECDICGKSYAVKCNLIIHRRNHTGEKPFRCKTCLKKYVSKSGLTSHLKRYPEHK
mmetsp:Transcript_11212/g.17033  ORF Transcript_11212/g.17033 Transcript_11212/m.17033 type:complete len:319 (-) Transcript_11212:511-1467(-)